MSPLLDIDMSREARPEDIPALVSLWREDGASGRSDPLPLKWLQDLLEHMDLAQDSRVVDSQDAVVGALITFDHHCSLGLIKRLEIVGSAEAVPALVNWGTSAARAAGASGLHLWRRRGAGQTQRLSDVGLGLARLFVRVDMCDLENLTPATSPAAYLVLTDRDETLSAATWARAYNSALGEYWRYPEMPVAAFEARRLNPERNPDLDVMIVTEDGEPAAIALCGMIEYEDPLRPQPVGLIRGIGVIPEHRRRGLGRVVLFEALQRLRAAGARSSSIHADAESETRAVDLYEKVGYHIGYEMEVWEELFSQ